MRRTLFLAAFAALLLASCKEDPEKLAAPYLAAARTCYQQGLYEQAKSQIDSVRILHPTALTARRAALELMKQVEAAEATRTIAYTDSLLAESQTQLDALLPRFRYEKNAAYQDLGIYYAPTQDLARNAVRNYLRATVDEQGTLLLTSFYSGAAYIHHHTLRVSDGATYAQTPPCAAPYESSNAVAKTERCDYTLGADSGVVAYIAQHAGQTLKVTYRGQKDYATTLTRDDTRAIADVYQLALALQTFRQLCAVSDEAHRKLQFYEAKEKNDSI